MLRFSVGIATGRVRYRALPLFLIRTGLARSKCKITVKLLSIRFSWPLMFLANHSVQMVSCAKRALNCRFLAHDFLSVFPDWLDDSRRFNMQRGLF